MKRILFLALCLCLLLCACGKSELLHRDRIPEWPFDMTAALELQTGENAFTADWTYSEGQSLFTLHAPQELSGVTVVCNAVESRIEKDGVQVDLPESSAFVLLDRAYRALSDGLVEPLQMEEGWLYDGMDRYGFEALGSSDGKLEIRFPKLEAEAVFTVTASETNVG